MISQIFSDKINYLKGMNHPKQSISVYYQCNGTEITKPTKSPPAGNLDHNFQFAETNHFAQLNQENRFIQTEASRRHGTETVRKTIDRIKRNGVFPGLG